MTTLPDTCDGFNVTHFCSKYSRDCVHGCCWHMDRVRQMVRRWFSLVGPAPRMGLVWKEPPAVRVPKPTKAEIEENKHCLRIAEIVKARRAEAWRAAFDRRWAGVPDRLWRYRDTGGMSAVGYDVDGYGSWGRHVRQWEDREDER